MRAPPMATRALLVGLLTVGACKRAELDVARAQVAQLAAVNKKQQLDLEHAQADNAALKKAAAEVEAHAREMKAASEHALEVAQDAYVHRDFKGAATIARAYVDAQPEKAWRLIGAAACGQKDLAGAHEAADRLDAEGKRIVTESCARAGLAL